jgi:hypothetical protein
VIAAHADWSVSPGKRWITVAKGDVGAWCVAAPVPVGDVSVLLDRLRAASAAAPVVLGLDMPVGLPVAYAGRYAAESDFPSFLRALASRPSFFEVCSDVAEVGPDRPFYPRQGRAGMKMAAHVAALGFDHRARMSRLCDLRTADRPAGAPLFWTLGPNQVGKAALSGWRDLLIPALLSADPPWLWPFAGDLPELVARGGTTIAETYPAEALRHLGLRMAGSKRRRNDRAALAGPLKGALVGFGATPAPELSTSIDDGFGLRPDGEDRFDSVLGLLCVLNVLAGHRSDGAPTTFTVRTWEGWVLGQAEPPSHAS